MKKYESATGMLCRSLENIDFAADDDVEFEVRRQMIRRRLVCEEVFDELEIIYPRVEELRKEKAGEVRYYIYDLQEYSDSLAGPSHCSTHRACPGSRYRACPGRR